MTTRHPHRALLALLGAVALFLTAGTAVAGAVGAHDADATVVRTEAPPAPATPVADSSGITDTGLDTVAGLGGKKSNDNKTLLIAGLVAAVVVLAGGVGLTQLRKREG